MKKSWRIHLSTYLLVAGMAGAQIGCSSADTRQASKDADTAYNDFRSYVSSVENATDTYADSVAWQNAAARTRAEYDARIAALEQHEENYDEARRQEIEALKGRYNAYWNKQYSQFNAQATTRSGGLAAEFRMEELENTTAANIRQAYESFIARIQANKDRYTKEDWKAINDYYHALDDRKNAVQSQLTDKDKYEIGKAKAKYVALRTEARFDPDVSKAASEVENAAENAGHKINNTATDLKEGAKTGASKAGNTAEKVGSEVKSGAQKAGTEMKSGAQKVGSEVKSNTKKAASEVKSGTKKAADKVEQKLDNDPENK